MKRVLQILLVAVSALALTLPALAVDSDDYWRQDDNGTWYYDYDAYNAAVAAEEAAKETEDVPQAEPVESVGTSDAGYVSGGLEESDDKYPVGSYVDPAGNVFSPDGELLSLGTTPAVEPDSDTSVPGEMLSGSDVVTDIEVLTTIAGLVSDIADDSPTYHVVDLRPADTTVIVPDGLKALVVSIFGEYHPVTTTALVSETVGDDVYQYYVETVAPGSAGVDYEWLAGVFLFGILLFCLMKLLGGVLK